MKSKINYKRYVIGPGESIEIEHTEDIVSEEPHPNDPTMLMIWTREHDHGDLFDTDDGSATGGED